MLKDSAIAKMTNAFRPGKLKHCERIDNFTKSKVVLIIELMFSFGMLCIFALEAGHYCNFYPINGTFQNFNPVRRLMAGQIPYKDFSDYLGLGHLYTGTLATIMFGGTYDASLIGFRFLSLICFVMLSVVIGWSMHFKEKNAVLAITNILLVFLFILPKTANTEATLEIVSALNCLRFVGNSARFIRGMIIPLSSCALLLIVRSKYLSSREMLQNVFFGMVAGFSFIWSNDYGVCCWLCIALFVLWYGQIRKYKFIKIAKNIGVEIISSIATLIIAVAITSQGNVSNWIRNTLSTGGYQRWYYLSAKALNIFGIDPSPIIIVQIVLCIFCLMKARKEASQGKTFDEYAILIYINLVCVIAAEEYRLFSGNMIHEVPVVVFSLSVIYLLLQFTLEKVTHNSYKSIMTFTVAASLIVSVVWIVPNAISEIRSKHSEKDGEYVAALGGYMTKYAEDLQNANTFLDGNTFFATYASAQEVVSDVFQPSGIDYIIHVLGDPQREQYMKSFERGNFQYVATINDQSEPEEDYAYWEQWVKRANWFFYRELYKNWHPVYQNSYEIYWERNKANEKNEYTGIETEIVNNEDGSVTIKIKTMMPVDGIADVFIDYSITDTRHLPFSSLFKPMLFVQNTGKPLIPKAKNYDCTYLRDVSKEYIPVSVQNGYGEVTLTAIPTQGTIFKINDCHCDVVYTISSQNILSTKEAVQAGK